MLSLNPLTHVREAVWLAKTGHRALHGLLGSLGECEHW